MRVQGPGGGALSFARVCLTGPRGIFELHATGIAGETEFFTADMQAGDDLVVTVTKEVYVPYEGGVEVIASLAGFIRGDANFDRRLDISDGIRILGFLFLGEPLPEGTIPGEPQEDPTPDNLDC